jgi:hypothetical protein
LLKRESEDGRRSFDAVIWIIPSRVFDRGQMSKRAGFASVFLAFCLFIAPSPTIGVLPVVSIALAQTSPTRSANDQTPNVKSVVNPWTGWSHDPVTVFTAIMAFFTFVIALAAVWQSAIARATARRQLRAYLFIESAGIMNVADPLVPVPEGQQPPQGAIRWRDSGPITLLTVKNSGQTPAFDVIHFGNIHFQAYPLTKPLPSFPAPDQNMTKFMIGPGGISTKNLVMPNLLTPEQVADLRASRAAIYVYGRIEYRDAFGRKRFTSYRMRHNALTGNVGVIGELTGSDQGNEAN